MITYRFYYSDGTAEELEFKDKKEAMDTARLAGDHLVDLIRLEDDESSD